MVFPNRIPSFRTRTNTLRVLLPVLAAGGLCLGAAPAHAFQVRSVTFDRSPYNITSSTEVSVQIVGTVEAADIIQGGVQVRLVDLDRQGLTALDSGRLAFDNRDSLLAAGDTVAGTVTFTLTCPRRIITGPSGSSGEDAAELAIQFPSGSVAGSGIAYCTPQNRRRTRRLPRRVLVWLASDTGVTQRRPLGYTLLVRPGDTAARPLGGRVVVLLSRVGQEGVVELLSQTLEADARTFTLTQLLNTQELEAGDYTLEVNYVDANDEVTGEALQRFTITPREQRPDPLGTSGG